mgnify:CR=1 FL=1
MASLEQVQQDIQTLPQEALDLVAQFVQLLKKSAATPDEQGVSPPTDTDESGGVYEQFEASGLIGCVSAEENLSTTYKQVLAEEWGRKYDHR